MDGDSRRNYKLLPPYIAGWFARPGDKEVFQSPSVDVSILVKGKNFKAIAAIDHKTNVVYKPSLKGHKK